jgi:uncharacterized protein YeaO (DUF488 family)
MRSRIRVAVTIKRVYEPAGPADGTRILVDRLWPRGVSKARAKLAFWFKDVAPSPKLRVWFGHRPERFTEFSRRYRKELTRNTAVNELRKLARRERVTLLYGAHDPKINHAAVLLAIVRGRSSRAAPKVARQTAKRQRATVPT